MAAGRVHRTDPNRESQRQGEPLLLLHLAGNLESAYRAWHS
uniref:Uncharacterized protein n=1 Tax=Anguilla anguilla TaxID=7936 RepID=A0A0E9W305_ANGAN